MEDKCHSKKEKLRNLGEIKTSVNLISIGSVIASAMSDSNGARTEAALKIEMSLSGLNEKFDAISNELKDLRAGLQHKLQQNQDVEAATPGGGGEKQATQQQQQKSEKLIYVRKSSDFAFYS